MQDANLWFFLKSYIKDHKKIIIFFILAILIFLMIMALYRLPLAAVTYAALLCGVLAIIFFIYDFYYYRKHNMMLMEKLSSIADTLDGLSMPRNFTEENWMHLLFVSFDSMEENQNKMNYTMTEMMDYYTMWVHQIKTPIAAMRLLLQSNDDNGSSELKREMNSELFKIEQYVEMVLSYMRLESESTDYVIKEYDLDEIIKQAVKKFSTPFINKKISLNFEETGLKVVSDEKWLGFAIEQVLSNAIKYTDEGSVTIRQAYLSEISTADSGVNKNDSGDEEKIIVIEDTGIGIEKSDLPRVFEKGYTGFNGRVEKKSTGIGLFLTKKILTKLGCSVDIESELDKGTKVILNLDFKDVKFD